MPNNLNQNTSSNNNNLNLAFNRIPEREYRLIRNQSKFVGSKYEIVHNQFGKVVFEFTDLLKYIFGKEVDIDNFLSQTNKTGEFLSQGSIYDLDYLKNHCLSKDEWKEVENLVRIPSEFANNSKVVPISAIYPTRNNDYYQYLLAGEHLFKLNVGAEMESLGGLEMVTIPANYFIKQPYPLDRVNDVWSSRFLEVKTSFQYIINFLSKDELEAHNSKLTFMENIRQLENKQSSSIPVSAMPPIP